MQGGGLHQEYSSHHQTAHLLLHQAEQKKGQLAQVSRVG